MIKSFLILITTFVLCSEIAYCNNSNKSVTFDILTLAQNWPQSTCLNENKAWNSEEPQCSPCKLTNKHGNWTLHGLWPSSIQGDHPTDCNKNMKFNLTSLDNDLKKQLDVMWPSYKKKSTNKKFWSHEWQKHGTCSLDIEITNSVSKYFSQAIQLLNSYNVGSIFRNSSIVPGNQYKLKNLAAAIQKSLNVKGFIHCVKNKLRNEQYLSQVDLCLDKTFKLIDCGKAGDYLSNCKRKSNIIYPNNLKTC